MSRAKAIRQAQTPKPLKHLKDEYVIRLLNSWVIQNEKVEEWELLPPNKQKARRYFEDQFRMAMCIAKNKPYISPKPQKPERPYKGFYEFIHKMRVAATERSYKYLFARKLHNGSKVVMIDGMYTAHNVLIDDDGSGELDLIKDDLVYHIQWGQNPPKFYYLPNMDMSEHHIKEGMNANNADLDELRKSLAMIESYIHTMETQGIDMSGLREKLEDARKKVKEKEATL